MSRELACDVAHKADDDLSTSLQGSETLVKPIHGFTGRKELDGGALCLPALIDHERGLFVIRLGGDDAIFLCTLA